MVSAGMIAAAARQAHGVDLAPFRELYPFQPKELAVDGGRMSYLDEGPKDGPVLLMLHGNPTWSFYYRRLISAFSPTHRVVVPDHLGCGLSDKPQGYAYRLEQHAANVRSLVERLDLRALTLVMHDWGGAIGMGFAMEAPERVKRLVVLNTAAFPSRHMPAVLTLARVPGVGALSIRGFNAFVRGALATCAVHKERLSPEVRAGYLAPYHSWATRIATLRFVQDIPMGPRHPSWSYLVRIGESLSGFQAHPMLIVWGAQDFVFNDHFLEEWRRRFPQAEVHRLEDAGHFVVEDAHERIIPWMRSFGA